MPREMVTPSPGLALRSPSASSCCQTWSLSRVKTSRPLAEGLIREMCAETLVRSFGRMPAATSRSLIAPESRPKVLRGSSAAAAAGGAEETGGDATAAGVEGGTGVDEVASAADREADEAGAGVEGVPRAALGTELVAGFPAPASAAASLSKQASRDTSSATFRHASMALTGSSLAQHRPPVIRQTVTNTARIGNVICQV